MTHAAPPSEGLVAGKYELLRLIGQGGMGSVWEARHVSLGTAAAIKFIEAEHAESEEARSRFDREAKAAATIQSKHAIQIYDHGVTDDGRPYIVMELLEGESLEKRIERLGHMPLADTARILQQVCRGLARAHERGIVHRDLKPDNIFLVRTPDEEEEIAKVLDFGIAKIQAAPGSAAATASTKTGAVLGTPFYMSPEQARGLRTVDHRTDIWSLGVIAFRCVTGRLPFEGESIGDLLVKICVAPIPTPSALVPGLPREFDAWFSRALEREPDQRFSTVSELSDALCFVAGVPVRSAPGSALGAPIGSSSPMRPAAASDADAVPWGEPHGANTPIEGMTNAPFTSEPLPRVPTGKGRLVAGVAVAGILAAAAGGVFLFRPTVSARSEAAHGIVAPPPPASSLSAAPEPKAAEPPQASKDKEDASEEPAALAEPEPPASPEEPAPEPPKPKPAPAQPRTAPASKTAPQRPRPQPARAAKDPGYNTTPPADPGPTTAPTPPRQEALPPAKTPKRNQYDPGY